MSRTAVFSLVAALSLVFSAKGASVLDPSFDPGTGAGGGLVERVLPLASGQVLVCGNFTSFNGKDRAYIARLNGDGSVDESFQAHPTYWVRNMSLQPDGKIIIGGFFKAVQGAARNLIARLNGDGSLDTSFDPGLGAHDSIAAGVDGNIDPFVFWTAVQPDGKILATGNFKNYNGASSQGLVRINPDGSRDGTFDVGGGLNSWGRHISILPNGQVLVSGWHSEYRSVSFNRLARINPDGSPDSSFTPNFGDVTAVYGTASMPNGKIMAVGHSLNEEGLFREQVRRLHPNGTKDESFNGFTNEKTESVVLQPDGKVIVGGYFTRANDTARRMVARFLPDGALDRTFAADLDNFVWSCALDKDGKLMIGGGFTSVDGVSRRGVARLETGASAPQPQDSAPVLSVTGAAQTSLTLSWTDASTVRTGYDVEQIGRFITKLASVGPGGRSHTVAGLSPGTSYTFRLKGYNSIGGTVYSANASGRTLATGGTEPVLSAPLVRSDDAFEFTLTSRSGLRYRVEASTNLANWSEVQQVQEVNGAVQVVDSAGSVLPRRFYRAVEVR